MTMKTDETDASTESLSPEQISARAKLERMIQERGIKPMTLEQLRSMGDLWPEDEDVDEFLEARERWRNESRRREIP